MYDIDNLPGKRWALDRRAKCGINGFMRPCQTVASDTANGHPNAEVCKSDQEIVYIVDDDDDFRGELAETLSYAGYNVETKPSVLELCKGVVSTKTGCILLDLKLPGMSGLDYQSWAQANGVHLPIIFISGQSDVNLAVHAMKNGAVDFFIKPCSEMHLRQAINAAIGKSRREYCSAQSSKLAFDLLMTLTPTKNSVAKMVADGYPTKLIAAKMGRSENTVKIHKHRIFNKLQVNSAASVTHIIDLAKSKRQFNIA